MANLSNINNKFIVESDGDVGIGVTTALDKLNVGDGNIRISQVGNVASQLILNTYQSALGNTTYKWFVGQTTSANSYSFQIGNGTTPYLHINSLLFGAAAGNVGIGTTTPDAILNISKTSFSTTFTSADSYIRIGKGENATNGYQFIGFGYNNGSADLVPAYIGYQQTGTPGNYTKGDLVFGTRNVTTNTAPTERMRIDSSGNVGIGTTTPGSKLDIGTSSGASMQFLYDTSQAYRNNISNYWNSSTDSRMDFNIGRTANVAPVTVMSVGYGGNVGIGTTSPITKLSNTAIRNSAASGLSTSLAGLNWEVPAGANSQGYIASFANTQTAAANANAGVLIEVGSTDTTTRLLSVESGGVNRFEVRGDGNVGIGTDSPSGKLHVSTGTDANVGNIEFFIGGTNASNARSGKIIKNTSSPYEMTIRASNFTNGNNLILNDTGGCVGIGTIPSGYLTIGYVARLYGGTQTYITFNNSTHTTQVVGGFAIGNDAAAARIIQRENQPIIFSTNNIDRMVIANGGNVGIGTTVTNGKLSVAADDGTSTPPLSSGIYVGPYQGNTAVGSAWSYSNSAATYTDFSSRYNSSDSNMRFIMKASATPVYAMTIKGDGRVGIGETSPTSKLHVVGGATNSQHIVRGPYTVGISGSGVGSQPLGFAYNFNGLYNTGYVVEVYAVFNHWSSGTAAYTYCYRKGVFMGYGAAGGTEILGPGGGVSDSGYVGAWTLATDNGGSTGYAQRILINKSAGSAAWNGTYWVQIVCSVPLDPTDVS